MEKEENLGGRGWEKGGFGVYDRGEKGYEEWR